MKIWILTNKTVTCYDTYNSCIVCAKTEQEARMITPNGKYFAYDSYGNRTWCKRPEDVQVEYLGTTTRKIQGVILASFNAG